MIMKLLFVHERFGALAGAEANILAAADGLKQRGHDVGLLHGPTTGICEGAWEAVFQRRFPLANNSHPARNNHARARAAVEAFRPDMIYLHKMGDSEVLEALLETGLPLVRMVHDHDLYCMRSYKYNYFTRRICERAASPFCLFPCGALIARNHGDGLPLKWVSYLSKLKEIKLNQKFHRLIVASRFMKRELERNGFEPDKIEIHPPVPPPGNSALRSTFSDRNLVIYAGQITRGKGVDVLLESLALVSVPFECLIFGEGNHRARCERLSRRLGLAERVHFKGYALPRELDEFRREASVAVVSSLWPEPFGAVGVEAMRHGLPVVAFDAGGVREWLVDGHTGWCPGWTAPNLPGVSRSCFATNHSPASWANRDGRWLRIAMTFQNTLMVWKPCSNASPTETKKRLFQPEKKTPNMKHQTKLVAITGGSGSGKTWLASFLQRRLGRSAARLSLDDFYLDRSHLPAAARVKINYDHPDAIDWTLFQRTLVECLQGQTASIPLYDFNTHTRLPVFKTFAPAPLLLVEGLWLLWHPHICELFDQTIYLDCPARLRLERRLSRDVAERGRTPESVQDQFWKGVAPMHEQFVEPQAKRADIVLTAPPGEAELCELVENLGMEILQTLQTTASEEGSFSREERLSQSA
jgi:uridine kinase/glycosyltransferase involved in cell wall biosynthesis